MKNNGLLKNIFGIALIMAFGLFITSCDNDSKPLPTVKLDVTVDGFTVDIAAEAENGTLWSWDYDDDSTSDSIASHKHTYAEGGEYTISCTVTGDGGSTTVTETVTIATVKKLLMAHPWVLADAGNNGLGYHITPELAIDQPAPNVLAIINAFQNDNDIPYDYLAEYDDVYTFGADDVYTMDFVNSNILIGWVYGGIYYENADYRGTCAYVGINVVTDTEPTDATWTVHENSSLTLSTVAASPEDPSTGGVAETVEFTGVNYVTFTHGGFLGIRDLTSTAIINSITADELAVTVFYHGYQGDPTSDGNLYQRPSFLIRLTFKPQPE